MSHPTLDLAGQDPRAVTDSARATSSVARTDDGSWVVLGHHAAGAVATDAVSYSSHVSRFLQIPDGLDGEEHAAFRAAIDTFFGPDQMDLLEPVVQEVIRELLVDVADGAGPDGIEVDVVSVIGAVFAMRAQTR